MFEDRSPPPHWSQGDTPGPRFDALESEFSAFANDRFQAALATESESEERAKAFVYQIVKTLGGPTEMSRHQLLMPAIGAARTDYSYQVLLLMSVTQQHETGFYALPVQLWRDVIQGYRDLQTGMQTERQLATHRSCSPAYFFQMSSIEVLPGPAFIVGVFANHEAVAPELRILMDEEAFSSALDHVALAAHVIEQQRQTKSAGWAQAIDMSSVILTMLIGAVYEENQKKDFLECSFEPEQLHERQFMGVRELTPPDSGHCCELNVVFANLSKPTETSSIYANEGFTEQKHAFTIERDDYGMVEIKAADEFQESDIDL